MKILVVEDEPILRETVTRRLQRDGYNVTAAESAEQAWLRFKKDHPDLIVLDIMLPGRNGFDFSKTIRQHSKVPILFLSARTSEEDRLRGFIVGGDDYLTKPFNLAELSARVAAILRRAYPEEKPQVEAGKIRVNPDTCEAFCGDRKLDLTPKEFALLHFFVSHPGKVFRRETLIERVWGPNAYVTPRTVDVHVRWLREKIEDDPAHPQHLITARGFGYRFEP
ncbi:MAG: DNA-binding response regulator [Fimbriimonadales bacterium]|jgi:DNA-binding response OmpR family regulator|nr:MAG: DNA-binding response regulator [Fimbriimonadales bacterium]